MQGRGGFQDESHLVMGSIGLRHMTRRRVLPNLWYLSDPQTLPKSPTVAMQGLFLFSVLTYTPSQKYILMMTSPRQDSIV